MSLGLNGKSRWMLCTAIVALGLVMTRETMAQDASPPTENSDLETVVVTGSRQTVSTSEEIKRSNTGIVNTITQNELDTLPDQSLPEALDRIPGVSSDIGYLTSKAQYATVRGFDSRYNSAEVDGNPIWNSSRNNRGAQLDIFPTGAVSQINVYDTVTPDQDGNSIGGHIELRTLRAFDGGDDPYLNIRAEAGDYVQGRIEDGKTPSYMFSAVGKDTFGSNNQFGFVFGVGATRDSWNDKYMTATPFSQINNIDVVNGDIFPSNYDQTLNHYSVYAKLEAHATDKFYAFLSAAFFEALENNQSFRTGPFLTATTVTNATEDSGTFTNVADESYLETYLFDRKEVLIGSGIDYRLNDTDQINVRLGWTNYSDFEDDETGSKFEGPTVSGTYLLTDNGPVVTLNPNTTTANPANWVYRNSKVSAQKVLPLNDDVYTITADYNSNNYTGAQGFGYEFGGGFRELDRNFDETLKDYTFPKSATIPTLANFVPAGTTINGASTVYINPAEFWDDVQDNATLTLAPAQTSDYRLIENVYSGFAEAVYGWGQYHGLAGVRVESTHSEDQTYNSVGTAGTIVPETYNVNYTDVMPNVQVYDDVTKALRLRAAYTETIARPDFNLYAMGQSVSYDVNGFPVISGTNPYLTPRVSFNYDLSSEYYAETFFASAAAFHKTMKKDEFSQEFYDYNAAGNVIETETIPLDTGSAYVNGFELNYVQNRADWLPEAIQGLHWNVNYTRLIGEWNVTLSNGSPRRVGGLRNQPTWVGNLGVGYTWGPLDLNVAVRFRGRTFSGTFGTNSYGDIWYNAYTRVDLQADYTITPSLKVFVDMRNLNNAELTEYTGENNAFTTWINPGPSFFIGVKYKPDLVN